MLWHAHHVIAQEDANNAEGLVSPHILVGVKQIRMRLDVAFARALVFASPAMVQVNSKGSAVAP